MILQSYLGSYLLYIDPWCLSQVFHSIGSLSIYLQFRENMTTDEALRTAPIIPACLTLFTGLILLLCKDSPKGNYKELKDKGVMIEVSVFASLRDGLWTSILISSSSSMLAVSELR